MRCASQDYDHQDAQRAWSPERTPVKESQIHGHQGSQGMLPRNKHRVIHLSDWTVLCADHVTKRGVTVQCVLMCFSLQSSSDVVDCDIQVWVPLVSKTLLFCQQPANCNVQAKTTTTKVQKELDPPQRTPVKESQIHVTEVVGECSPEEVRLFSQKVMFFR